jgi:hypothetical protein
MTREELIAYGQRHFGKYWKIRLSEELHCDPSTITRLASGETAEVSRRMELEAKNMIRREQMRYMTLHANDVRYS